MTPQEYYGLLRLLHQLDIRTARMMRVLFLLGDKMSEIDDQLAAELAAEQKTDADVQAEAEALAELDAEIARLITDFEAAGPLNDTQRGLFQQIRQAMADRDTAAQTQASDVKAQTAAIRAADAPPAA